MSKVFFQGVNNTNATSEFLNKNGSRPVITKHTKKVKESRDYIIGKIVRDFSIKNETEFNIKDLIAVCKEKYELTNMHLATLVSSLEDDFRDKKTFPYRFNRNGDIMKVFITR